jgi:GT2 family glycosyltransferase
MESVAHLNPTFHVMLNGLAPETRTPFTDMANSIPGARLKHSSVRLGFGAAANRIIRQGDSSLVLFITDDVILHDGSLAKLIETMQDPEIGLCGMKLIFPVDSPDKSKPAGRVQHVGHAIDIRGEVTHPLMGWSPENPRCCKSREVQSVTGGVFIVRKNLFLRVGGFWEGYGLGYFEDVELCISIRSILIEKDAYYKVWINAEATATHHTNMSMMKAGIPIPMQVNKFLFQQRNGHRLVNDTFTFW